jgi:hypothetical protein
VWVAAQDNLAATGKPRLYQRCRNRRQRKVIAGAVS